MYLQLMLYSITCAFLGGIFIAQVIARASKNINNPGILGFMVLAIAFIGLGGILMGNITIMPGARFLQAGAELFIVTLAAVLACALWLLLVHGKLLRNEG